ncbi:acyl-CoA thioesterase [Variovorax arabinosiphilus]|uniref:acyl-CoA thioesterase n=1 Tax=Variovorax arabinosiphilus TaxID=3053498 RepID=UPI0025753B6F|nr:MULTISPECIES: thioesterase family protein [unclassified Variovorax]MDM0122335.1 thioesterase family protein [Variovorax sp. J2L1-78]MDM0131136.1 thioesterase family protein [Variovorax sp. J2L1-63]MDM0235098.1 thioesterase family protein [Variovorax sp. J2R1-6]
MTTQHIFDKALALHHSDIRVGHFTGTTSPDYWNMVGPFGGTTAAVVLQSVLRHPDLLGAPIALTVNYAAAIEAGAFDVQATAVRTNRSTQHWTVQITQAGASGAPQVTTTATVVTAARRETWSTNDLPMPLVPGPEQTERMTIGPKGVAWIGQYDMRPVRGSIPTQWDGGGEHSETMLWLRDADPRPLDFPALASMSDMFYPRVWLRRAKPVPAGTVSITTYFHADASHLAEVGCGYLLGRAVGQQFQNGFFDQSAQLWSQAGALLATSNQIVYFKE